MFNYALPYPTVFFYLFIYIPLIIIFMMPGNFLLDTLMLYINAKDFKLNPKDFINKNIKNVFAFGLISNFISGIYIYIYTAIYDCYQNDWKVILPAYCISLIMIFFFNYRWTFKRNSSKRINFETSASLALATSLRVVYLLFILEFVTWILTWLYFNTNILAPKWLFPDFY